MGHALPVSTATRRAVLTKSAWVLTMLRACSSDVTTPYELMWTANVRMQSMASLIACGHGRDSEVRSERQPLAWGGGAAGRAEKASKRCRRPGHLLRLTVVSKTESGLEQQQEAHGGAEDGVSGVGDKEVVVVLEVYGNYAMECSEHREGSHLGERARRVHPSSSGLLLRGAVHDPRRRAGGACACACACGSTATWGMTE